MTAFSLITFECVSHSGEDVHVVGDHPALGCWDPAKSVPLRSARPRDPVHVSEPVSVPAGVPLQYKYVLMSGGQPRWETIQGNRHLHPSQQELTVRDELDRIVSEATPEQSYDEEVEMVWKGDAATVTASHASSPSTESLASGAVLVVCYILPLDIHKTPSGEWDIDWNQDSITAKKQQQQTERKRVLWIGCPGITVSEDDQPGLTAALQAFSCVPIFLDSSLHSLFYIGERAHVTHQHAEIARAHGLHHVWAVPGSRRELTRVTAAAAQASAAPTFGPLSTT